MNRAQLRFQRGYVLFIVECVRTAIDACASEATFSLKGTAAADDASLERDNFLSNQAIRMALNADSIQQISLAKAPEGFGFFIYTQLTKGAAQPRVDSTRSQRKEQLLVFHQSRHPFLRTTSTFK